MMRATDSDNKTKNNKEPESATSSLCSLLYLTKTCYEIIMHSSFATIQTQITL